jgi:hypothetical protein
MSPDPTPSGVSGTPTAAQIQQVIDNIHKIQHWNDYVYNEGNASLFSNAFGLLSYDDHSDLGLAIALSIMQGVCSAVGGLGGPAGNFVGSFLPGMLSYWATTPPLNLPATFGGLAVRLQKMSMAFDQQLAGYAADVPGNWNQAFTYGTTTATLSDLADFDFPAETDPAFFPLAQAGIFALDQWIWKSVLQAKFVVTQFDDPGSFPNFNASEWDPPISSAVAYYQKNPAYFVNWYWGPVNYSNQPPQPPGSQPIIFPPYQWFFNAWNIGTGVDTGFNEGIPFLSDGGMSVPACQYLFIDSTPGNTINGAGLFTRSEVFNNLGIRTASHSSAPPLP